MGFGKYVLDAERRVVPCTGLEAWAFAFKEENRRVARTTLDGAEISTVFLGLDHRFGTKGDPIVFETLVFGGVYDQEMERYCTWAEAEAGHAAMVEKVQNALAASFA